jgi:peptidoglycan/LPS O-acetylase OafA/YrhL
MATASRNLNFVRVFAVWGIVMQHTLFAGLARDEHAAVAIFVQYAFSLQCLYVLCLFSGAALRGEWNATLSKQPLGEYLSIGLRRYGVPFFLLSMAWVVFSQLFRGNASLPKLLDTVVLFTYDPSSAGSYWYLHMLVVLWLAWPLFAPLMADDKSSAAVVLGLTCLRCTPIGTSSMLGLWRALPAMILFLVGYRWGFDAGGIARRHPIWVSGAFVTTLATRLWRLGTKIGESFPPFPEVLSLIQPMLDVVTFVTGAVLVVEVVGRLSAPLQQKWVKWTAGRSYDAYIFHDFAIPLVGQAIAAIPGIAWPARVLLAIPGSILVFWMAVLVGVVVRGFDVPRKLIYGR